MNSNQSRSSTGVDPLLNQADPLSPSAVPTGATGTVVYDEYMKDEELDGSDEISDDSGHDGISSKYAPLREQDRFLPIANIAKIMKRAIPENGKIAKDSRECIQECVSEFISFITSEASDRCHQEKRKTINGDDILFAMLALGFDHYAEPLTLYLHKYRETTKTDRTILGGSSSSGPSPASGPSATTTTTITASAPAAAASGNHQQPTAAVASITTAAVQSSARAKQQQPSISLAQQHQQHQHQQNHQQQQTEELDENSTIFFYPEEEAYP